MTTVQIDERASVATPIVAQGPPPREPGSPTEPSRPEQPHPLREGEGTEQPSEEPDERTRPEEEGGA